MIESKCIAVVQEDTAGARTRTWSTAVKRSLTTAHYFECSEPYCSDEWSQTKGTRRPIGNNGRQFKDEDRRIDIIDTALIRASSCTYYYLFTFHSLVSVETSLQDQRMGLSGARGEPFRILKCYMPNASRTRSRKIQNYRQARVEEK